MLAVLGRGLVPLEPLGDDLAISGVRALHDALDIREASGITNEELTVKDSIMLDMNPQGGLAAEPGANRQLRNYREALDMNKPGVTFRAREMVGRMVLVKIKHEDYQGTPQERVASVAALS